MAKARQGEANVHEASAEALVTAYAAQVRGIVDMAWEHCKNDSTLRKGYAVELVDEHPWITSPERRVVVLQLTDNLEAANPLKLSTPLKVQEALRSIACAAMTQDVWDELEFAEKMRAGEEQDR